MTERPRSGRPVGSPLGVYVHFPWCLSKCPYCDFLSVAAERQEIPSAAYADRVIVELERRLEVLRRAGPNYFLASVFFGGGTPSLWEPSELGRVLSAIRKGFDHDGEAPEITVECNPTSFDLGRALALREAGVGRISLGVQGLEAERLEFLGRLHDPDGALRALEAAQQAGFERVSADLIFGVHGQKAAAAIRDVARVVATGVSHVSAYGLTIEPGTRFGALHKEGRLPLLPETDAADSFLAVAETLGERGFEHYEVSNYAMAGQKSRHNLGYWRGHDFLALGVGAWGTVQLDDRRLRYRNIVSPERYLALGDDANDPFSESSPLLAQYEPLDSETRLLERMMLGLRLAEGVDIAEAERDTGATFWDPKRERRAARLKERGRLEWDGQRLRIPEPSWLLLDATLAELL